MNLDRTPSNDVTGSARPEGAEGEKCVDISRYYDMMYPWT